MRDDPAIRNDGGSREAPVVRAPATRGGARRFPLLSFVLLAMGVAGGVVFGRWWAERRSHDTTTIRSTPSVIVAVRDLARLEGAEYRVERVISLRDRQSRFFGLVDAEDAILLVASGTIVAGVDLSTVRDGDVVIDEARRSARIVLPSSTVFTARLDNDKTFVFGRDTDVLAERKESLETRARQEAERTLLAAAEEGGIVSRSNDNVRKAVETLVRTLGYGSVTVTFREVAPSGERR
jgi:hypothetical protein